MKALISVLFFLGSLLFFHYDIAAQCNAPSQFTFTKVSLSTVHVSWDAVDNGLYYEVRFRESGGSWNISSTNAPAKIFTGLNGQLSYDVEVRTKCDACAGESWSDWAIAPPFSPDDLSLDPNNDNCQIVSDCQPELEALIQGVIDNTPTDEECRFWWSDCDELVNEPLSYPTEADSPISRNGKVGIGGVSRFDIDPNFLLHVQTPVTNLLTGGAIKAIGVKNGLFLGANVGLHAEGAVGVRAIADTPEGIGVDVVGENFGVKSISQDGTAVFGQSANGKAGDFDGNVHINNGYLKIDVNIIKREEGLLTIDPGEFNFYDTGTLELKKIHASEKIFAKEVEVKLPPFGPPDYVFEENYPLLSLPELKRYLDRHNHLPNIPSAKEMEEKGSLNVAEMQFKQLEKIEELTLYILQLNERLDKLEAENNSLKKQVQELSK